MGLSADENSVNALVDAFLSHVNIDILLSDLYLSQVPTSHY